jgi:YesN/AraC family two-component response regulator
MSNKILIVDDDKEFRSELRDFLDGYPTEEAGSGEEALRILRRPNEIGLVLLDVNMPGVSGIDILSEIKKTDPDISIVILTGYSSKDVAVAALKGKADDYLEKPLDIEKVNEIVERFMDGKRQEKGIDTASINGKIEKVKDFIERNCFKKVTLTDAAASVCLSPKYLSRVFKEVTSKSLSQYRLHIKVECAKELLTNRVHNINQISEKLGYENTESFIRQFKKFTKKTPSEFRNALESKKTKTVRKKTGR